MTSIPNNNSRQERTAMNPQCSYGTRRRRITSLMIASSLVAIAASTLLVETNAFSTKSFSPFPPIVLSSSSSSTLLRAKNAAPPKRRSSTLQDLSLLEALDLSASSLSAAVPAQEDDTELEEGAAASDLLSNNGASSSSASPAPLNPELEFNMHVGKALDTLRSDYPKILTQQLDFSIYDKNIQVIDPSGVKVHGLAAYKNAFRLLHALVKFIYCPERSGLTFRMCYDKARENIRIHWNAQVVPRAVFGGSRQTLYVDGISVYCLDKKSGDINQHRIEQLLINQNPVRPKEGVIAALTEEHGVVVPSFCKDNDRATAVSRRSTTVFFQQHQQTMLIPSLAGTGKTQQPSSLFAMEASSGNGGGSSGGSSAESSQHAGLDLEALETKNKSRKKFGLKPLTPEQFLELQSQVQEMDSEQRQRAAAADAAAKEERARAQAAATGKSGSNSANALQRLFGSVLENTCESNADCERPELCCDLGFKKMCCSSGSLVGLQANPQAMREYATVPVPVGVNDDFPDSRAGSSRRSY